jgi:hypothetical protein
MLVSCLVTEWPPVACKFRPILFILHATGSHAVTIAWDWQALEYNLYVTGGHSGTIYMQLAASRMQTLHALAASCVQSLQFFASTLRDQLFELKNEDAINNSENLRDACAC